MAEGLAKLMGTVSMADSSIPTNTTNVLVPKIVGINKRKTCDVDQTKQDVSVVNIVTFMEGDNCSEKSSPFFLQILLLRRWAARAKVEIC